MRMKELLRWLDAFGLPQSPWAEEPADWATGLNLLARLLHPTLAKRVEEEEGMKKKNGGDEAEEEEEEEEEGVSEREEGGGGEEEGKEKPLPPEDHRQLIRRRTSSQFHPSTQLPLQEALELAERVLGVPQFVVVADLKKGPVENQLALFIALCALHFAVGPADTKPYRDFQFAFRIYFDMDSDGSKRECAGCGQLVHLIERLVLNGGQVWHRSCLKCALCGRQLYRGAFHFLPSSDGLFRMECVEHRTNAILFGDPKHRLALLPSSLTSSLMTTSHHSQTHQQEQDRRASLASVSLGGGHAPQCSPPPRPPPPKIGPKSSPIARRRMAAAEEETEEESIEKKIASAAAARHDAPVPRPRTSLLLKKQEEEKQPEKTAWEVLEYPEELNPFGSDEEVVEEEEEEEEENDGKRRGREGQKEGAKEEKGGGGEGPNPFESDSETEEEEREEGMVRVENPQDRVLLGSPKSGDGECSSDIGSAGSPSPAPVTPMVQLVRPQQPNQKEKPPLPASLYPRVLSVDCCPSETEEMERKCQYVPPLGPMVFRVGVVEKQQPVAKTTAAPPVDQQQLLHELDTKLRRLHSQLDKWEITGARIEGQMQRELGQKENQVWRKTSKLANEFGQLVEQRCAALAMEGLLVRRYMDTFLALAHAELDRQMREEGRGTTNDEANKRRQHNSLLAELLDIRNELTELERREGEARKAAAKGATTAEKKAEAKKEAKKEKDREKEKQQREKEQRPAKEGEEAGEDGGGKMMKDGGGGQKENTKGGGGGRLLKNTLKNLKKKL